MTVFLRVLESSVEQKPEALLSAIRAVCASVPSRDVPVFDLSPSAFCTVPGSPFSYWVSETIRSVFTTNRNMTGIGGTTKCGLGTLDDFRFLRLWWESPAKKWIAFPKGGTFSRWYSSVLLTLDWMNDGLELKTFVEAKVGSASRKIQAQEFYFRPGLTWPRRTNGLSFRAMPAGCIFADKGPAAFVEDDNVDTLLALSAIMNSRAFVYLVSVQLARTELAQSYEVGLIQQTPVPNLSQGDSASLAHLARRAWSLRRSLDTTNETSHAFFLPLGLNDELTRLDRANVERELEVLQRQVDDAAYALYGIGADDRAAIEGNSMRAPEAGTADENDDEDDASAGSEEEELVGESVDGFASWLIGVAFGRFDPRLATGERGNPSEPEPFDPLPSRSPGMYPEGEKPADRPDVLVDDEGHPDDLAARARAVVERVKVDVPENLRGWLAKEFFPLHIKMYSKSRRKAPIYWQLATPSASYSVWIYTHAFSKDTLFRVQNDYVAHKLAHEERRLESLASELRDGATAAQRKALARQEALVEELRAFLDEVKRVAPLWRPNLDDGVIINFAPLWRLVPQNKSWQKELKSTWDALCEGKYDWAHLAMHLWPERVVPKCAKDRSLAIAHGLEDVFWVEGVDTKWTARKTPTRPVDELVHERTSAGVKAALKSLLEAPASRAGSSGGTRQVTRRRKAV
jgi:hypothetical protein